MNSKLVKLMLTFFLVIFLNPVASAEVKTITAEGFYIMIDESTESPATAKARARDLAKQVAIEEINLYVESFSKVKNSVLTEDVIRAISFGVLRVQESDVTIEVAENDKLLFRCRLVANFAVEDIAEEVMRDKKELLSLTQRNKELERQISGVNAELRELEKSYSRSTDDKQREQIRKKIIGNEKKFEVSRLIDDGNNFMVKKDFRNAAKCYENALQSDSLNAALFCCLGDAYIGLKNYKDAIANYKKAAKIDPSYVDVYRRLGFAYEQAGDYGEAKKNYMKAENYPQ